MDFQKFRIRIFDNWSSLNVLVTGGASFIGSHLVDRLAKLGRNVVIADNFSSGKWENLQYEFIKKAEKYDDIDGIIAELLYKG